MMLLYHIYGKAADYSLKDLMKRIRPKVLFVVCLLPGRVLYYRWVRDLKASDVWRFFGVHLQIQVFANVAD